jgi:hypothetical protein
MTITPTRPTRQLTRDEAKVLAHYAAGESAKTITINTGFDMTLVGRVLDEHAGNDRARAHALVLEYTERAQTVAAARGVSAPPALAPPAAAKTPAAAKKSTPAATAPENTEPENTEPENTEPESSGPESSGPQGAGPEPAGGLEGLLQAAEAAGVPRLQRAAVKIRDLAAELRTDLAGHTREVTLRAEQAELEARLAAVKEQLRPRRTPPALADARAADAGAAPAVDTKAVRAWAAEQGLDCPARGRIPGAVADAYRAAHTAAVTA